MICCRDESINSFDFFSNEFILFLMHLRFKFIILKILQVPMQKTTTTLNKTDLITKQDSTKTPKILQPKIATLQEILKFASSYRVTKISDNQFIEMFLN
jgi:hypothetical protein